MVRRWAVLLGLLPLALLMGLAARDLEPLVSDQLASRAAERLTADGLGWARVAVVGRDVEIAGETAEPGVRALAAPSVARVAGVRTIADRTGLVADQSPYRWSIDVTAGRVVLSGHIPNASIRTEIEQGIRAAMPGREIVDRQQLGRGAPQGFAEAAAFLVRNVASVSAGNAHLNDLKISLQAVVEKDETIQALRETLVNPPAGFALADLTLSLPRASPFLFELERDAQGLAVSGHVPGSAVRSRLIAALRAAAGGQAVVDRLQDASGEPAGFEAAALFLIDQTARLTAGRASLRDRGLAIEGSAPDAAAYRQVVAAWRDRLPPGFVAGSVSVTAPLIAPYRLGIRLDGGTVRVSGHVPDEAVRDNVLATLRTGQSALAIDDRLQFGLGAPARFAESALEAALIASLLESGEVVLSDQVLAIIGRVRSFDAEEALKAAAGRLPTGFSVGDLRLQPARIAPFAWSAGLSGDDLTLTGYLPSPSVRAAMLAQARTLFEGRRVVDQMRIADGALPDFALAAGFGLGQLARLSEGKVAILGNQVTVQGRGRAGVDSAAIAAAAGGLPTGFALAGGEVVAAVPVARPFAMTIMRSADRLTLQGVAMSEAEKAAILEAARLALPGLRFDEHIGLADGVPEGLDWVAANRFALLQLSRLREGQARLEDQALTIEGEAADRASYVAVNLAVRATPLPGGSRLGAAAIRPPVVSPYGWFIETGASGVLLQGYVPSDAVRQQNRAAAAEAFGSSPIRDTQELAAGAPENFAEAARAAIALAARLPRGRIDLQDRRLRVSGVGAAPDQAEGLRGALRDLTLPGWQVVDALQVPGPATVAPTAPVQTVAAVPIAPELASRCQAQAREVLGAGTITFQLSRDRLRPEGAALVGRIAAVLKQCPTISFTVEGHTDSDGPSDQNLDLSQRRAQAVVAMLIAQGVAASRLRAEGFGASRPLAPNDSIANKARNRRIDFVARP